MEIRWSWDFNKNYGIFKKIELNTIKKDETAVRGVQGF